MLKNIAAALLATSLIAGPALAAQPSGDAGSAPAATTAPNTATAPAKQATAIKSVKKVKHARKATHRHIARVHGRTMKVAQHGKVSHKQAARIAKPITGKSDKSGKAEKSST
jgi:hypothetical protein